MLSDKPALYVCSPLSSNNLAVFMGLCDFQLLHDGRGGGNGGLFVDHLVCPSISNPNMRDLII